MLSDMIFFLKNFEGIIGALLGVIVTLVLTNLLRHLGKLYIYATEIKTEFTRLDGYGCMKDCDILEAQYATFDLDVEIYNNSEVPKALRDFAFRFYCDKELLLEETPDDNRTARSNGHWLIRDGFYIYNLNPKTISRLSFHLSLGEEDTSKIKKFNKIVISCKNHKHKEIVLKKASASTQLHITEESRN